MLVSAKRYKKLLLTIDEYKPRTLMEIGTWNGKQARKMIARAQLYNQNIKYYGFDIFEGMDRSTRKKEGHGKPVAREAGVREFLESSTNGAEIELHVGYTSDTLAKFQPPDEGIDFIFIDGGHSTETIKNDWNYVKNMMSHTTVVIFDDYYAGETDIGCFSEISQLQNDETYSVEVLEPGDGDARGYITSRKFHLVKVILAP